MDLSDQFAAFAREYPYRRVRFGSHIWRYRCGGAADGPPLLVLAGGTMVPDPLFVVIRVLGRNYRVIAPAYPPASTMDELVAGVTAILDAEKTTATYVWGSSFGGYLAQCLVRASPDRVEGLALAQTGVRHFVGSVPIMVLRFFLRLAPAALVRAFIWRTWQALLVDMGPDRKFWSALLRGILDHELSKAHLLAMMGAMADFTGRHRPTAGDLAGWDRPVLILQSEHDRAFAGQVAEIRSVYPQATCHTIVGAGHGALFTHTDQYLEQLGAFFADARAAASSARPSSPGSNDPGP